MLIPKQSRHPMTLHRICISIPLPRDPLPEDVGTRLRRTFGAGVSTYLNTAHPSTALRVRSQGAKTRVARETRLDRVMLSGVEA